MKYKKHTFYSHLVELGSLHTALDERGLSAKERDELVIIVEEHIHIIVLDVALSELTNTDKKHFLTHMRHNRHNDAWEFLKEKTENIENKIKERVADLLQEFHKDIWSITSS